MQPACLLLLGSLVVVNSHPFSTSLKESSRKLKNVVCPGSRSECPDGYVCCKTHEVSKYGCCPLANPVCCSDKDYCCPSGYTCQKGSKHCIKGDHTLLQLAVAQGSVREPPLPMGSLDPEFSDENGCGDNEKCCLVTDLKRRFYNIINPVCCSDKIHCCTPGTTCDLKKSVCKGGNHSHPLLLLVGQTKEYEAKVKCPDGGQCRDQHMCCKPATSCCSPDKLIQ